MEPEARYLPSWALELEVQAASAVCSWCDFRLDLLGSVRDGRLKPARRSCLVSYLKLLVQLSYYPSLPLKQVQVYRSFGSMYYTFIHM